MKLLTISDKEGRTHFAERNKYENSNRLFWGESTYEKTVEQYLSSTEITIKLEWYNQ